MTKTMMGNMKFQAVYILLDIVLYWSISDVGMTYASDVALKESDVGVTYTSDVGMTYASDVAVNGSDVGMTYASDVALNESDVIQTLGMTEEELLATCSYVKYEVRCFEPNMTSRVQLLRATSQLTIVKL